MLEDRLPQFANTAVSAIAEIGEPAANGRASAEATRPGGMRKSRNIRHAGLEEAAHVAASIAGIGLCVVARDLSLQRWRSESSDASRSAIVVDCR